MTALFEMALVKMLLVKVIWGSRGRQAEVLIILTYVKEMLLSGKVKVLALQLGELLSEYQMKIATAESCTGGLISASITEVPGSSAWFEQGFVTYSNEAKTKLLGVDSGLVAHHGAVSEEVVRAMLFGALSKSDADVGVAISGVAGPGGGTPEKPVGTVWLAWGSLESYKVKRFMFEGDRQRVRKNASQKALSVCINWLHSSSS